MSFLQPFIDEYKKDPDPWGALGTGTGGVLYSFILGAALTTLTEGIINDVLHPHRSAPAPTTVSVPSAQP